MVVNEYEKTYVSVQKALWAIESLDAVVEFLRKQTSPVSCKEIGTAVFGPDYSRFRTYPVRMGKILSHLRRGNFIKMEKREGPPIEVEVMEFIRTDKNEEPPMLTVHDEKGREFRISNPNYTLFFRGGYWGKVKKSIPSTVKTYIWVAG